MRFVMDEKFISSLFHSLLLFLSTRFSLLLPLSFLWYFHSSHNLIWTCSTVLVTRHIHFKFTPLSRNKTTH